METIINKLDKETRNYISNVVGDIEPENVDAVVDAIQTDMFTGANILINLLIQKFLNEEMNHWELKIELEDLRHNLTTYLLKEGK